MLLRPTEHITRPIPTPFCFCPHATRQTRLSASGLPTDAYRYATPIFISHTLRETYTQFRRAHTRPRLPPNCRSTPCFASFGSLYSRKRCRGAHFIMFSFHVEHTSCHSPKPQRLSRFSLVYAYLYIASLHVFRLSVCFFPSLRSFSRCRSAADDRASAPLRRFCFRAPHRRPACRFRRRSFAFRFSAVVLPLFLISRSLFASCPMAHRNLFVCFSLLPAFRAFPSMIRSASSPVFD